MASLLENAKLLLGRQPIGIWELDKPDIQFRGTYWDFEESKYYDENYWIWESFILHDTLHFVVKKSAESQLSNVPVTTYEVMSKLRFKSTVKVLKGDSLLFYDGVRVFNHHNHQYNVRRTIVKDNLMEIIVY